MVADALAPCVARTWAAMILIMHNRQVLVLAEENNFNYLCYISVEVRYKLSIYVPSEKFNT